MVVLVDANIIIDVLQYRSPFDADARQVLTLCAQKKITGILAAHTIPTLFYVMRKFYDQQLLRKTLANLCNIFMVSATTEQKILNALNNISFSDFEDSLQEECALEFQADYIITRNTKDFKNSRIKVLSPPDFINVMSNV